MIFAYDGDGNLAKRTDANGTVDYIGDYFEKNITTGVETWRCALGSTLVANVVGGVLSYVHPDQLGSVESASNGATTQYFPYGLVQTSSGGLPTDHQFQGQQDQTGVGLYHMGARWYDPTIGMWTQPDTLIPNPFDPESYNHYAFVNGYPLENRDPTGHCTEGVDCPTTGTSGSGPSQAGGGYPYCEFTKSCCDGGDGSSGSSPPDQSGQGQQGCFPATCTDYPLGGGYVLHCIDGVCVTVWVGVPVPSAQPPPPNGDDPSGGTDTGRYNKGYATFDEALKAARQNAGDLGSDTYKMYDPKTGTLIGEMSADGTRGWRVDSGHVNWWDWSGGKKGTGGQYGHAFFSSDQTGPHSEYIGYAPWLNDEGHSPGWQNTQ